MGRLQTAKLVCECQSLCLLWVDVPLEEAKARAIDGPGGPILIVDGCERGPEPTDVLIQKCNGYSLYREGNA